MKRIEEYIKYLETLNYAAQTIEGKDCSLDQFKHWCGKEEKQITRTDIKAYVKHLRTLPIEQNTVVIKFNILKKYFTYLIRRNYLLINPCIGITVKRERRSIQKDILTQQEMKYLLNEPKDTAEDIRDKAMMEVLYATGIRVSELEQLNLSDLNLKEREIHIHEVKKRRHRSIPIGSKTVEVLTAYLLKSRKKLVKKNPESSVFISLHGKRLCKKLISHILKKHIRRSGITKNITPHCFRHSCATHMLENGAPVEIIQELLGHQRLSSTEIYMRVDWKKGFQIHD